MNERFVHETLELRSAKDSTEIDMKWMLTGKEKSSIDVAELWEQYEFGLFNNISPTVAGYLRFSVVRGI
jgi:hypothetical protein